MQDNYQCPQCTYTTYVDTTVVGLTKDGPLCPNCKVHLVPKKP